MIASAAVTLSNPLSDRFVNARRRQRRHLRRPDDAAGQRAPSPSTIPPVTTLAGDITESGGALALTAPAPARLNLTNPNVYSGGTILNAGAATGAGTLAVGTNTSSLARGR